MVAEIRGAGGLANTVGEGEVMRAKLANSSLVETGMSSWFLPIFDRRAAFIKGTKKAFTVTNMAGPRTTITYMPGQSVQLDGGLIAVAVEKKETRPHR